MPWKANNPGCPCCEDCSPILIGDWTEISGTWSDDLNYWNTESSNAIAISGGTGDTFRVYTRFKCDDAGDVVRIIVAWDSSDDYLYAEFEASEYYLGALKVTGSISPDVTTNNSGDPSRFHKHAPYWSYSSGFLGARIYYDGIRWWLDVLGFDDWWHSDTMLGDYVPVGGSASGTATVSALSSVPANTGPGKLRLFQVKDGVTSQLGEDYEVGRLIPGEWLDAQVCYDGSTLRATIDNISYGQDVIATGSKIGMGTGAITSKVRFESFDWFPVIGSDEDECRCQGLWPGCFNGLPPGYMKLVVSGISGDSDCDCELYNGTWVIEPRNNLSTPSVIQYVFNDPDTFNRVCDFHVDDDKASGYISIVITAPTTSVPKYKLFIEMQLFGVSSPFLWPGVGRYELLFDDPIDCLLFDDLTVPFKEASDPDEHCIWSNATVKITSIA